MKRFNEHRIGTFRIKVTQISEHTFPYSHKLVVMQLENTFNGLLRL
jgi:hypothetical protein